MKITVQYSVLFFVMIVVSSGACHQRPKTSFRATLEPLKKNKDKLLTEVSSTFDIKLRVTVCNLSDKKLFLPEFHLPSVHVNVWRRDSLGVYKDYSENFIGLLEGELIFGADTNVKAFKYERDSFADSIAKAIMVMCKASGKIDKEYLTKNNEEIFYANLEGTRYFKPGECLVDTLTLNGLKVQGGDYKIVFHDIVGPRPSNDPSSEAFGKFLFDNIPPKLKGYEKWQGVILSDTLNIFVKKE